MTFALDINALTLIYKRPRMMTFALNTAYIKVILRVILKLRFESKFNSNCELPSHEKNITVYYVLFYTGKYINTHKNT